MNRVYTGRKKGIKPTSYNSIVYLQRKYSTPLCVPLCFPLSGLSHSTPIHSPIIQHIIPLHHHFSKPLVGGTSPMNLTVP